MATAVAAAAAAAAAERPCCSAAAAAAAPPPPQERMQRLHAWGWGGVQSGSMLDLSGRASGGARRGICMATGSLGNLLHIFLHLGDSFQDKT